jgi:hypothetical protein
MLIEICCKCGFVHKDSRIVIDTKPYRAYKPHYHWIPTTGEIQHDGFRLHATLCAACCSSDSIDWKEFFEQKSKTPEKYWVKGSLNAPLPERFIEWASGLYMEQARYFQFD